MLRGGDDDHVGDVSGLDPRSRLANVNSAGPHLGGFGGECSCLSACCCVGEHRSKHNDVCSYDVHQTQRGTTFLAQVWIDRRCLVLTICKRNMYAHRRSAIDVTVEKSLGFIYQCSGGTGGHDVRTGSKKLSQGLFRPCTCTKAMHTLVHTAGPAVHINLIQIRTALAMIDMSSYPCMLGTLTTS